MGGGNRKKEQYRRCVIGHGVGGVRRVVLFSARLRMLFLCFPALNTTILQCFKFISICH